MFKTAFQHQFIDSNSILIKLKNHINLCFEKWEKKEIYAPIVVICQSSGYGKSRSLYEYAQSNITIFMCLRDENDTGYPPRSKLCSTFIDSFKHTKSIEVVLVALIQASLEFYDMIEKDSNFSKEQIANEFRDYQPWLQNDVKFTKKDNTLVSFNERVEQLISSNEKCDLDKLKESINQRMQTLTFVIDEAHVLANKYINGRSYFLELRTAIKDLFKDFKIAFLLTSTNTSIANFKLSEYQTTDSQRATNLRTYPPFCKLVYCDQLKSMEYKDNFKNAFHKEKKLLSFINQRDPVNTLFYYGRPLWCSINTANNHLFRQNILELAKLKLIRADDWSKLQLGNIRYASLAVLASATNVLNNIAIINREFSSALIAGYMATLFHENDNCNVLSLRYVSEPILAEAANFFLSNDSILKTILKTFHDTLISPNIVSTGLIGESIFEIILLIAKNNSNKNGSYFSKPIKVEELLINLIGQDGFNKIPKNFRSKSIFKGIVSFTHFNQKLDILTKDDLLYDFLMRCAAGRFKTNFPKFDHFIPIVYSENKIGLILIQIKNRADLTTENKLKAIVDELNFDYFSKDSKSDYFTDIELNDENCLKVLINLGSDYKKVFFSSKTLIISSMEAFNIETEIKQVLKEILNVSRSDSNQFDDVDVSRIVTYGCAREDYFKNLKAKKRKPN